ncbi:tRNA (adenine(37)-N6)-methyltransferase-like [Euwallacea fornicatus]|uniref:tRNA (adenine(37)-N6)-methyltransferase-like n=1 Tax=Euwallacea fornicatus TaxID=995702 RepID=UPI00338E07D1
MSISDIASNLQQQLTVARQEINNLRKQLNTLQHVHRKEIHNILGLLEQGQCCKCKTSSPPTPSENSKLNLRPIGTINSQFPSIRGTARQSSITMNNAMARLTLNKDTFTNPSHLLEGLENYSHLWIIFVFHVHGNHTKAKVAPPRLNGQRLGVFATRSPHRPCPIGLSLVQIDRIEGGVIYFSGVDMVDGTPVLDVKPYIPRYDRVEGEVEVPRWVSEPSVDRLEVTFEAGALDTHIAKEKADLITKVLQEDPRSVYLRHKLGCSHYTWNVEDLAVECVFDNANRTVKVLKIFQNKAT